MMRQAGSPGGIVVAIADERALVDVGVAPPVEGRAAGVGDHQHDEPVLETLAEIVEAQRGQHQQRWIKEQQMSLHPGRIVDEPELRLRRQAEEQRPERPVPLHRLVEAVGGPRRRQTMGVQQPSAPIEVRQRIPGRHPPAVSANPSASGPSTTSSAVRRARVMRVRAPERALRRPTHRRPVVEPDGPALLLIA
jgi:hypothetical protein